MNIANIYVCDLGCHLPARMEIQFIVVLFVVSGLCCSGIYSTYHIEYAFNKTFIKIKAYINIVSPKRSRIVCYRSIKIRTYRTRCDMFPGLKNSSMVTLLWSNTFRIYTSYWSMFVTQVYWIISQIAKFMGPTWGPPGSFRPQMGPILAQWTLLSGISCSTSNSVTYLWN